MDDLMLEESLREALHAGESRAVPASDLASVTAARGRVVLRRRRGYVAAGVAAVAVVVVAAWGIVAAPDRSSEPMPAPDPAPVEHVFPGTWVRTLPEGSPPDRTYVVDNVLHRPDGDVELTGYDDAGMVGETVAGVVVLGEKEQPSFHSWYLLVTPTGEVQVLGDGMYTGAREAVVSPDGRLLARDTTVVDLTDMSVVAQIPDDADILDSWTADGIRYEAARHTMLWQPGSAPHPLATSRVRGALTRSPDGRWLVGRDLSVTDTETGERRWLAGGPLTTPAPWGSGLNVVWEDADHVVLTVASFLVRCDVRSGDCERASDLLPLASNDAAQLSPTAVD